MSGVEIEMLIEKGQQFCLFTLSKNNRDDDNDSIVLDKSLVRKRYI